MARSVASLFIVITTFWGYSGSCASRLPAAANAFASPPAMRTGLPRQSSSLRRKRNPMTAAPLEGSASEDDGVSSPSSALSLPLLGAACIALTSLAAYANYIPGPLIDATAPPPFFATLPFGVILSGSYDPYTPSLIYRDVGATVLSIVGAGAFVKVITSLASSGRLESRDSRKILHTLSAPLFMLLWPLYSHAYGARIFAAIVPLLNAVKIIMAGTGGGGAELAGAVSRSGDPEEALGGPFYYVLVLITCILLFGTDSPVAVVACATMAMGDGLADLVGRRLGWSNKWSFNKSKSMAGSAAFVAGSFFGSFGLITWLTKMGAIDPLSLGTLGLVERLFAIAVISAGVELVPLADDNWTVPFSAAVLSALWLS